MGGMSDLRRIQLSRHVHAGEQRRSGTGWSNSGLVASGDGLVVDTLYDLHLTRQLAALYAEVQPTAPAQVVNTHHNGDHCWGNEVFAGAEIIAHKGCAERFAAFTPAAAVALQRRPDPPAHLRELCEEWAPFDFDGITLTPPTRVIDGDATLDVGGVRVDLLHVGPAHTEGDLVVWVPEEGVVLMGDVLFHQCTPIGWEGSTEQWIAALARVEELAPEHVVPGHGPVCGIDGVAAARRYLVDVQAAARDGWERGVTVLECCAGIDPGPWAMWDEPWRLAANVHRVYRECDGAGWDDPFDTVAVMSDVATLRHQIEAAR